MKTFIRIFVICFQVVCLASQALRYDRVFLTQEDELEAQCLDGSPGAHYIYKGDPNKVLVFFYGGGWCGQSTVADTLQACYQRRKGPLGSSNFTTSTIDISSGIGSGDMNNYFKDWTKVFLTYCDGSSHQGYKKDPIQYKGVKLYFKGQRLVKGHFKSLEKSIGLLTKVQNIVLSGASAGGAATYFWTNWLRDAAKAKNIWSLVDSGIFLNQKDTSGVYSYQQKIINMMKISNAETPPPCSECVSKHKDEIYKCFLAQNMYPYIKVPLFNVQSQYDSWSIPNLLGINCLNGESLESCNEEQLQVIENYHQKTRALLFKMNLQLKDAGAWAPVCADHIYVQSAKFYNEDYRIPQGSVYSPTEVIKRWIQRVPDQANYVHIDQGRWPANILCSGLPKYIIPKIQKKASILHKSIKALRKQ